MATHKLARSMVPGFHPDDEEFRDPDGRAHEERPGKDADGSNGQDEQGESESDKTDGKASENESDGD